MASKLPGWSPLWNEYPDYIWYTSEEVKKDIGGSVNAKWITNTCAIRLSRTLNYNKIPVPRKFSGLHTLAGSDKKRYAFRVQEMQRWLVFTLGKPNFEIKKKEGKVFDKTRLNKLKGIFGFNIRFPDATGHLDLWGGKKFSSEHKMSRDYWKAATKIWLWKTTSIT